MRHIARRSLSVFLALAMLLSAAPFAFAAETEEALDEWTENTPTTLEEVADEPIDESAKSEAESVADETEPAAEETVEPAEEESTEPVSEETDDAEEETQETTEEATEPISEETGDTATEETEPIDETAEVMEPTEFVETVENEELLLDYQLTEEAMGAAATTGENMEAAGLKIISRTSNNVTTGVTYDKIISRNASDQQNVGFLTKVNLTGNVTIKAGYKGYYAPGSTVSSRAENAKNLGWGFSKTSILASEYESAADHEGTVVMATNGDYFNMGTGEPLGYLIMEGNTIKGTGEPYFAILKDGSAVICDAGTDTSDVQEAVSGPFLLIRDGKNVAPVDNTLAPRNSVGICADGSVVFYLNDGRQAPTSVGMTLNEVASVLLDAGCVTALYLDGGGSATVAARPEGSSRLQVINSPSDGAEREVASALLVVSTAEHSGEFDHAAITPNDELYTPNSTIQFQAVGVDSAGFPADLPDDLTWSLEDSGMGSIDNSGLFTSNGTTGVVTVQLLRDGRAVGSTSVQVVVPDEIRFNSEEVSLGFTDTTDLGLVVRYQDRDVNIKNGDILWELSDDKLGTFDGNLFTSADEESLNGTITATWASNIQLSASIHVIVGMLPTIVWNFEDVQNEDGSVTLAEEYYGNLLTHSNYGRGGKESFEIVSIDDDEPVRFGEKSLKLNYDFTSCGAVTEGACVGTTEAMQIPGTPTAIGVWVYAPEGVGIEWQGDGTQAGFWLRGYVVDGTGAVQPYDLTLEPKAVSGDQQPGIYWEGWKYIEADLTKLSPPYSIQRGMTFRLMYVAGTMMGTKTANSIYFDNLQFVYGTNVDDVDNPIVNSITVNNQELTNGAVITDKTFTIRADYSDVENKYTSGVDPSTVRMFIDGVNVAGNDHYSFAVQQSDNYAELYNLQLTDGEHTVTVSLRDKFGNEVEETRTFTVQAGNTAPATIRIAPVEDRAVLGKKITLEIRAEGDTVSQSETEIRLSNMFPDYSVEFGSSYSGTTEYSKLSGTITISAERKFTLLSIDDDLIARVVVDVPPTLTQNEVFTYEVKAGSYETSKGYYSTYRFAEQELPVAAPLQVISEPVLVHEGGTTVIQIVDQDEKPVAGAKLYLASDDSLIGTANEDGELGTNYFSKTAATTRVYAKTDDGSMSFQYNVYSYDPEKIENPLDYVMFNVVSGKNAATSKNVTWFSDALNGGEQSLRYRIQGTEGWKTIQAEQTFLSFTKGGNNKAVNANLVTLTGLVPGSVYEYQVGQGDAWSAIADFTQSESDSFFVMSDIQADDMSNVNIMMQQITKGGYAFGIQTGDAIDDVTGYGEVAQIADLLGAENVNGSPVLHVLGNHEYYGDADALTAKALFGLDVTSPGSHYSVTYGDVYVAVINYTNTNEQLISALDWLVKDAQASDATWKILTLHQPPYYTNASGGNMPIYTYVPDAAEEAGINVVFSGHDHSLARTNPLRDDQIDEKKGVLYYIGGSSGEKSYGLTSQNIFDYGKIFALATVDFTATYIGVTADKYKMVLNVYDVTGADTECVDTYTLYTELGSCADAGHELENALYSDGKLTCNQCGDEVDPAEVKYTGWATDKGTGRSMYFISGEPKTGEFLLDHDVFYFDENGVAYDGEVVIDEVTMEFDNGKLIGGYTGFITKTDGNTYHYEDGKMTFGWYETEGKWYSFNTETGVMCTGIHVQPDAEARSKNAYYDFAADGVLERGYFNPVGYYYWAGLPKANAWVQTGAQSNDPDAWYRTNGNGHFVKDPAGGETVVIAIDGVEYTFENSTGKLLKGSIVNDNGTLRYYWVGEPVNDGWFELDGKTYYAFEDGYLAKGSVVIDGENYMFGSDGHLITEGAIVYADLTDDYHILTAKLTNVHNMVAVRFAIWIVANGASNDSVVWVKAEKNGDGDWTADVPMCKFGAQAGEVYAIHAYGTNEDADAFLVGTTVSVPVAAPHEFTDDQDATCNYCGFERQVEIEKEPTVSMFRLYNPNTGEHFYTGSTDERDSLEEIGWQYEGIAWNAPSRSGSPVHRLFNPNSGDHHYTMSWEEVQNLVEVGWQYEGVAWNSASASSSNVANYRLYNPNAETGIHHYTSSLEERDNLVELGWKYEGIAWFGILV